MIKLCGVTKKFNTRVLFEKVDLVIKKGEFVSLRGDSGSGKSTLLNIISMIDYDYTGSVLINDFEITKTLSKQNRMLKNKSISFLFQDYGLVENETIKENLILALRYRLQKSEIYSKATLEMDKIGLYIDLESPVFTLSGGEKQRLALVILILRDTDIILCDEPTGSLDDGNKLVVMEKLKDLNELGKTIVMVTHDDFCEKYATKCYHISDL